MKLHNQCLGCLERQISNFLSSLSESRLDSESLDSEKLREIDQSCKAVIRSYANATFEASCATSQLASQVLLESTPLESAPLESTLPQATPAQAAPNLTPPQAAIAVYECLRTKLSTRDPFAHIKSQSVKKAREICSMLLAASPQFYPPSPSLDSAHNRALLTWAIKLALLGNVIDYGSQEAFKFDTQHFCLEKLSFGAWDFDVLFDRLEGLKETDSTLLYLADNAGENVFDRVLLETLHALYPRLKLIYMLRAQPIINDLSMEDRALWSDMEGLCEVANSSMKSPGFVPQAASDEARVYFENAGLIISKGMGNFECLESHKDPRLFMLFKVKCDVVAAFCGQPKGKMMLLHNI